MIDILDRIERGLLNQDLSIMTNEPLVVSDEPVTTKTVAGLVNDALLKGAMCVLAVAVNEDGYNDLVADEETPTMVVGESERMDKLLQHGSAGHVCSILLVTDAFQSPKNRFVPNRVALYGLMKPDDADAADTEEG